MGMPNLFFIIYFNWTIESNRLSLR
jgi:hypothetical protein